MPSGRSWLPWLSSDATRGHPRTTDLREVVKRGILYVLRWRHILVRWQDELPHDLPPWGTVRWYFLEDGGMPERLGAG